MPIIESLKAKLTPRPKDNKRIVIVGAGPTGLGAATRLSELQYDNWVLFDSYDEAGGLAYTYKDPQGFLWDVGGHVIFSHYKYFDDVLDQAVAEYNTHERESWVWMRGKFIPYPLQNNIGRLPPQDLEKCLHGLVEIQNATYDAPPKNFEEWLMRKMGKGIYDVFLGPYNFKVWAHYPKDMNVEWMGERVAPVDLKKILSNVVHQRDDIGWGPNATFRYPKYGGTGAIWKGVADKLPQEKLRFKKTVKSVDARKKVLVFSDGSVEKYDALVSTMQLDTLCTLTQGLSGKGLAHKAPDFRYSTSHIIGLGIKGQPPAHLKSKAWMYFPEDDAPFYRCTVLSNYSEHMVPQPGKQWSLMFEVAQSAFKPVNKDTLVDEVIAGAKSTKLISESDEIVSRHHMIFDHGYPTPFYGRDQLCKPIFEELERHDIYSRGRFGAWKYEVSNQDHSFMQGVEVADAVLGLDTSFAKQTTFLQPGVANAPQTRNDDPFTKFADQQAVAVPKKATHLIMRQEAVHNAAYEGGDSSPSASENST
ncbi:unnamed protein product [Vitrella brassicaformis CCMP3155]|uniref:Amine oxidase domain-containing protein n=2 Tax=Vitrella brassicaformis TaxID=1169539 RepID=A0A0G4EWU7_VITBC|nr:unnamed protein product [Vitrella brassicaformis CCMP3155]|eukprot:CEM02549.1 unnamed protein product [Vitrella brassicaformis CCMP3155]